jgi:hypothetical protein
MPDFENLSFNETVLIQQFWERMLAVFLPLFFLNSRVSCGNASISSTLTKSGYKDLQVNLFKRDLMVCDFFLSFNFGFEFKSTLNSGNWYFQFLLQGFISLTVVVL